MNGYKKINWLGSKGQNIELRAYCNIVMQETEINLDGDIIKGQAEPRTDANLELYVDGIKIDSCWDINFWEIIDVPQLPGIKKIWGLKVAMNAEQAAKVGEFLKSVIEDGKQQEVKEHEAAKATEEKAEIIEIATSILTKVANTPKRQDGALMTKQEARTWAKNYNNVMNEGGEGYIPEVITQEDVAWAQKILSA